MRPIPQTVEVLEHLARSTGEPDLLAQVQRMADHVQAVVPDCLGLSLAWLQEGLTFTLVSSDVEIGLFDALQYLDGGPCVDAVDAGTALVTDAEDLLLEDRWRLFSQVTAARGVRCTVTFPLTRAGRTVGSANLYGASDRAFEGHHQLLADILGADAPGAVRNADLSFSSRLRAEQAPQVLRAQEDVDRAAGYLASLDATDVDSALERLCQAAARAGLPVEQLARALLDLHHD